MASIQGGTFRTVEAIGQALIDQIPGLEGRDPEEIGEKALRNPKYARIFTHSPQDYSEIDVSTAVRKGMPEFLGGGGDFGETAKESLEGLGELAGDPIGTGISMGKLGLAGIQEGIEASPGITKMGGAGGQLLGLLSKIPLGEDTREGAREFGREVKRSVSPEGVQNRPMLAMSNALMAVPGGGIAKGASTAGRFGKALNTFKKVRQFADPAELPMTALSKGANLLSKPKVAATLKKGLQGAVEFAEALRTLDVPLRMDVFAGALGFTTSKGPRFVRNMIARGRPDESFQRETVVRDATGRADPGTVTESGADVQREFRRMPEDEAETIILTRALEAVDRFNDGVNKAYEEGLASLPLKEPIDVGLDTRRAASSILNEMNVRVLGAEALEVTDTPLSAIDAQRGQIPSGVFEGGQKQTRRRVATGEGEVEFSDFGDRYGGTTPIPDIGGGRAAIEDSFLRIINAPEQVAVSDMINFRRSIGAAISTLGADISGPARVELTRLQDLIRQRLNDEVDGYRTTMKDYEDGQIALENFHQELGLEPGKITEDGKIRGINKSTVVKRLFRTLAENADETSSATLRELEAVGKDPSLTPAIVGIESRPLVGGGLVVKSEASQIGRAVLGAATLSGAAFGKLLIAPAALVFSPRAVNELVLRLLSPESKVMDRAQRTAGRVKSAKEKTQKVTQKAREIVEAIHKADESSGGALRGLARQGLTLGQLLERLQISTGVEFEEGDLAQSPKASTTLSTLGGIDLNPPAR